MNLQEELLKIKKMMNLYEYNDKYSSYKKGWVKVTSDCYVIKEPLAIDVFLFPYTEEEYKGFLIDLKLNDEIIGQFHSVIDLEDTGMLMNDIEISSRYQNKGLGKLLTLIAMCVSNEFLGFYNVDVRGITPNQGKVYTSLEKTVYDESGNISHEKAQNIINNVIDNLLDSINKI